MTHFRDSFTIMETANTTFGKRTFISLSKPLAVFLALLFVGCIVATGLLVYLLSPCTALAKVKESSLIVYDKYSDDLEHTTKNAVTHQQETSSSSGASAAPSGAEEPSSPSSTTEEPKTEDAPRHAEKEDLDVRLPRSIQPDSYRIRLIPFIQEGNFTFLGEVTILVNVSVASSNITLHAVDLTIDSVFVYESGTPEAEIFVAVKDVANDTERQFLIIYLEEEVQKGKQYYVHIKYKGVLNDLLEGFYRSSYKVYNETRWIAATQFQATDARQAFPCFDEPALKATFQLSLARLWNMTSISNMPKIGDSEPLADLPNYVWDHYQQSLPMSTYLVAFVISDFNYVSSGTFSIWARKSALSQAQYGLQIGPKILQFYEDFFGIKYPLPKLDMIALPDFSAGAMENWGLITYRESVLLYENKVSSKGSMQRIAHVIAHELAHQWFGNLVTPVWWSDLWLNEGFATYMESLGANAVNPHLKELDQVVVNELHGAFALDALKSSHQISVKVNNPDEINEIFDRISYSKGSALLRMMQHFLTMDVLKRGLNKYLSARLYKNAEQDDLWRTLTEQSHEEGVLDNSTTIKEIMDTWTLQVGFPVVTVTRNYQTSAARFHQHRFRVDSGSDPEEAKELWWIPITFVDFNGSASTVWMRPEPVLELEDVPISSDDWMLVNVNQTGYYRVNYDPKNWDMLIAQLQEPRGHLAFDPKNRAQLIDDALNLASAGLLDYGVAMDVTRYLVQEREYVPWKAAFTGLDYIFEMFVRTAHFDKFKTYMLNLMRSFYEELEFNENDYDEQLTIYSRYEVYSRACKMDVRDCVIKSVQQYQNWKNSPSPDNDNPISENLREVVYCTAISVGGQEEWEFAWQRYLNANVGNEKETLLMALGCSREIWILSRYLEWAITDNSGIRKHDSARVFAAVAHNPIGQELSYRFLKTHWNQIGAYLGTSSMSLSSIVRSCTIKFNTQLEVDDFKAFMGSRINDFGVFLRTAQQSIEQGEANVKWMKNHFENITNWLISANIY